MIIGLFEEKPAKAEQFSPQRHGQSGRRVTRTKWWLSGSKQLFCSHQKPPRAWKSIFTILSKQGCATAVKALAGQNSCITSRCRSGNGNAFLTQISKWHRPILPVDCSSRIAVFFDLANSKPSCLKPLFSFWRNSLFEGRLGLAGDHFLWQSVPGTNGLRGLRVKPCPQLNTPHAHWLPKLPVHIWGQSLAYGCVVLVILPFQHRKGFFPLWRKGPQCHISAWW